MKKNNKGFSLVELIVVVLIMGIIAVALAPQVIKWVENSRKAADAAAYDELYEEIQVALVNRAASTAVAASGNYGYVFEISDTSVTVSFGSKTYTVGATPGATAITAAGVYGDSGASTDNFIKALGDVDPKWDSFKKKSTDATPAAYQITVKSDRTVERSTTPTPETNY